MIVGRKMPTKDVNKRRKATRERVARFRDRQKKGLAQPDTGVTGVGVTEKLTDAPIKRVTQNVTSVVTQADIDNLPQSLKFQINSTTRSRQIFRMPDNLRERQEVAVRRFRGY